jgi:hypothetical protein
MAEDIKAIDALNYPFSTEAWKLRVGAEDVREAMKTVLKGLLKGQPPPSADSITGSTPKEFVAQLDEAGYDKAIIVGLKMWSYRKHKLSWDFTVDEVYQLTKDFPDRLIGAASYNPFKIEESLREIERGVKKYGFKYVFFHPGSFGLPVHDRRFYPCYTKCLELGVPVGWQVGHSAELFPSETGRPVYVENVALDFPNLTIVLSHAGWPWTEEFIAMVWKFPNVYGDIAAYPPRALEPNLMRFMNGTRGRDKMLFATNGIDLGYRQQFMDLEVMKEETKRMVLRENAIRVFKL